MSEYYQHVRDCLEGARNGRFCAGAESGAAEIKRLTDALGLAQQEIERLKDPQNFLREVSSEWQTTVGDTKVTCHDRMVEGVLCRWWGDGETPKGVALIDKALESAEDTRPDDGEGQSAALSEIDR